jgi:ABC-type sugar transport system permease subunit
VQATARQPRAAVRVQRAAPRGRLHRRRLLEFIGFIALWIIGFIAFQAYPLLQSLYISFATLSFQASGVQWLWVGILNYQNALTVDVNFVPYLVQAVIGVIIEMPLIICFSLAAATMLKQGLFGTMFFRGLFFLPVVVGSSAVMSQLLGTGGVPIIVAGGFASEIYRAVGATIGHDLFQIFQDIALVLWRSGVQVLLFLAGLYGVNPTYYEVARIDGANAWQTFLKVTLPAISPMLVLITIYTLVDLFSDPILDPVLNYITTVGLGGDLQLGLAGAMGWMSFVIVFIMLIIIFRYASRHTYYAGER